MDIVKISILLLYLIGLVAIILFSWLYLNRTIRAIREIGLHAPPYISLMIKISIGVAIATAVLIGIFLLTNFY